MLLTSNPGTLPWASPGSFRDLSPCAAFHQVAVKSFDNAKCSKSRHMACARDAELGVLRLLVEAAVPHAHVANLLDLLSGPASVGHGSRRDPWAGLDPILWSFSLTSLL